MFLWFPPSCGFHLSVVSTLCGYSVVCTLLLFASSCGYSWCPFRGLHSALWFPLSCGLHLRVVSTLPVVTLWFPSVVCTFVVYTQPWFPPSRGLHLCMVPPSLWFPPSRGFHLSWFAPSRGLHSAVVSTLPWFASSRGSHPPCGYSVVSLSWFTLCRGFHPPVVCIFTWFPTLSWLLCGVHPGFWLKLA